MSCVSLEMNDADVLAPGGHRCLRRGLKKYPSIDKKLWDASSRWILQWDNIVKHPGARARGCHCDIHKPPWLYPDLGTCIHFMRRRHVGHVVATRCNSVSRRCRTHIEVYISYDSRCTKTRSDRDTRLCSTGVLILSFSVESRLHIRRFSLV